MGFLNRLKFYQKPFLLQSYGVKVGPEPQDWGPRDLGTLGLGTWDPPQSLKVGPGTPLKNLYIFT